MKTRFFITATGTAIGKTFVTAALTRQAKALGRSVMSYKPVASGFDPAKWEESDTGILLQSLEWPATPENIDRLSPWRYKAPLAPSMAARLERKTLDFRALVDWSRKAAEGPENIIMIEGVGGVMVPMDDTHTVLDWIEETGIPVLLVTGSYLGTVSHTLTALAVLEQRKIPLHGLIINESENAPVPLMDTAKELARWTQVPLFPVARRTAKDGWEDVPELRALLA